MPRKAPKRSKARKPPQRTAKAFTGQNESHTGHGNGSPCKIITESNESRTGQGYPHRNAEKPTQGKRTASHKWNGQRQTGNAQQGHGRTQKAEKDTDGRKKPRLSILENRLKMFFWSKILPLKIFCRLLGQPDPRIKKY